MSVIYNEKGEVIRSFVGKNANATDDRWLYQVQLSEKGDTQTVEKNQHAGFASRAPDGAKLIVSKISDSYRVSVAEYDGIVNEDLGSGESRGYASDGGAIVCEIHFKNDGSVDLTAPSDFNVIGNMTVSGTIDAVGNISSEADVISDSAATAISLTDHYHIGNLGYKTTPSQMTGGTAKPAGAPEGDATGNIDMQGKDLLDIGGTGTDYSSHGHEQGPDSNGDTEVKTNTPS